MASLAPVNIKGREAGMMTWNIICTSDAPILLAEGILSSSTKSTPVIFLMITIINVHTCLKRSAIARQFQTKA